MPSTPPPTPPAWAKVAQERMTELGLIQKDLCEPLGVTTRAAVSHYMTGRRELRADQAFRLATLLKLDFTDLYSGDLAESVAETAVSHTQRNIQRARALARDGFIAIPATLLTRSMRQELAKAAMSASREGTVEEATVEVLIEALLSA